MLPTLFKPAHAPERYEEIDESGIRASISWIGPWASRGSFLAIAGGVDEEISYPGGVTVTRRVPLKYPSSIYDNVYAHSIQMRSEGRITSSADEAGTWDLCRITVAFKSYPFGFTSGDAPMVSLNMDSSANMTTVPGTAFEFPSDSLRIDQNAGVPVPTIDFTLTMHFMPDLLTSVYNGLVGRVNNDTFYLPDGTAVLPGYLLYLGPSSQTTLRIGNVYNHTVAHRLQYRFIKHNEIMRADGGGFEAPRRVGTSADPEYLIPDAALMGIYG